MRARVAPDERSPEGMERLRSQMSTHPGVHGVQVNPRTGSILVHGEVGAQLEKAIREYLELLEEAGPENVPEAGVESAVLLVRNIDRRLRLSSGSRLSLRWLVPAAFVGLGVRQLLRDGPAVGNVPWFVLLWYGVDSFFKLYPHHAPKAPDHKAN